MKTKSGRRGVRKTSILKWLLPAAVLIAGAGILINRGFETGRRPVETAHAAALPYFETAEAAQPYPETLSPFQFAAHISHAYRIAKDMPGVLAQQPCYCFCMNEHHKSLLDCFTTYHAAGCSICQQEALLSERLTRAGESAGEVRKAIQRGDWRRQPLG